MSYHVYAVVRGNLVRVWSPNEHQALGLAASYRKLYPEDCDAWIVGTCRGSERVAAICRVPSLILTEEN